jgi:3-mercaptopyruvate sulfurtransferase SseA
MFSRGVIVQCPSGLRAAAAVLAAELLCGDGMFTK